MTWFSPDETSSWAPGDWDELNDKAVTVIVDGLTHVGTVWLAFLDDGPDGTDSLVVVDWSEGRRLSWPRKQPAWIEIKEA